MSLQSGTIYEKMNMQFEYNRRDYINVYETPLFFFVYNTDNYFHYVYDTLPYLISYLHLRKSIPEIKLLMQYPNDQKMSFYPFVLEFLELLEIGRDDIVLVNNETLYTSVHISTSYTHDIDSNLPPRKEIYGFYQSIVSRVKSMNISMEVPKKIYVSRRTWLHGDFSNIGTNYTMRRRMINEDELVERLVSDEYQEVFTERLSTIEKILYFAGATHVIGAIGGGISNVLFSSATTRLEAIISPGFLEVNKRFKYSLDCVDVYYNYNTQHVEFGEFKKYMRVKFDEGIGEIEEIIGDKLIISYTDVSNTGWNSECIFKKVEMSKDQVARLDNGLNSAWKILL
jgi:capsular polysaccharide biosynthesis protein